MSAKSPQPIFLRDYRPPVYFVSAIDLDIRLEHNATHIRSKLKIDPNPGLSGGNEPLMLRGEDIELVSLKLDGAELPANAIRLTSKNLTVKAAPKTSFVLEIETRCDPSANTQLSGLYLSNNVYCTQCEAEGFRRITYFLDQPDILAVYTVRIEAEKKTHPILLSNGNLIETGNVPSTNRHYALWHDPYPKPSYLFALVCGDLGVVKDNFTTMSGRKVDLAIYLERGKEDRCAYAMESLKKAMRWDEDKFAREYDLDVFNIVAVSDFNMGAMENKGLNIFNDKFILASPQTATDMDYARIESIIAHEYFHNWTGNRITCRDWFQLCLKEGLTVYRDQEFSADMRSRAVARIEDVRTLRSHQFPEDAGPLSHPVRPESFIEINNFYTATVYEKGAELVRMIATILGPKGFHAGISLYFERHDGHAATVDDFLECFENATGVDLGQFRLWYSQAGTPEISYELNHDAKSKTLDLRISQRLRPTPGQPKKTALQIPLRLALLNPEGHPYTLRSSSKSELDGDILHLKTETENIRFSGIENLPVLSLCRNFSAPIRIVSDPGDEILLFLMRYDNDPFNRWEAAQSCALRLLVKGYDELRSGKQFSFNPEFFTVLDEILNNATLEPAYRAEFLKFPGQSDIAVQLRENIDSEIVQRSHLELQKAVAQSLENRLTELLNLERTGDGYSPDAVSAGRRALRNGALALLCARGDDAAADRAVHHLNHSNNMTDTIAALTALTHMDIRHREIHLEAFYKRFKSDPLVVDKWFTLHAISSHPQTPEKVEALTSHSAFSWRNPNRVRALIGAFATLNPAGFHRRDGAGYRLVANSVIRLDKTNPQVAARLLGSFRSWKTMESRCRDHAKAALQSVVQSPDLSPDVLEIVGKTLSAE